MGLEIFRKLAAMRICLFRSFRMFDGYFNLFSCENALAANRHQKRLLLWIQI